MTPEERLQRIAELRDANAESVAHIEERRREREEDPFAFDMAMLADRRATGEEADLHFTEATGEPIGSAYSEKSDPMRQMVFRVQEDGLARAVAAVPAPSNADGRLFGDWRDRALAKSIGICIAEMRREWRRDMKAERDARDKRIASLEAENRKLKAMLGDVLARLDQNGDKVKELAAEVESEHKDREALMSEFETRFGLLRGLAGDWNAV